MDTARLAPTGTVHLTTRGRRSGDPRRIEIWYVVVAGRLLVTGTPGPRGWLANLRADPHARLEVDGKVHEVLAREVVDVDERRRLVEGAWVAQPWYAAQRAGLEDWVERSPLVELVAPTS
ncbi:nitroreductase family deazaflavin-dependent oxidoreductase [Phycicoccus avicenniae]|uniref:nitroreductase family deazaflavin-dependent oxidoreductase n=1 Tax=Phycicoccus avicenniae TaxID=2828860 RepID=UPI003D266EBF